MRAIKQLSIVFCLAVFLLAACGSKTDNSTVDLDTNETDDKLNESLQGLIENEYEDLEITAAILERTEILPGAAIPLTITITNSGSENIIYTMGSGSFETPQALIMEIPGLQSILPSDYLGIATMDMRTNELLPGESIQHTLHIRAIEPNKNFNDYTYNKWGEGEQYIGDIKWNKLQEEYSDLTAAAVDTYKGTVYFLYYINDDEHLNPTLSATGYASCDFTIKVTE